MGTALPQSALPQSASSCPPLPLIGTATVWTSPLIPMVSLVSSLVAACNWVLCVSKEALHAHCCSSPAAQGCITLVLKSRLPLQCGMAQRSAHLHPCAAHSCCQQASADLLGHSVKMSCAAHSATGCNGRALHCTRSSTQGQHTHDCSKAPQQLACAVCALELDVLALQAQPTSRAAAGPMSHSRHRQPHTRNSMARRASTRQSLFAVMAQQWPSTLQGMASPWQWTWST